MNVRKPINYGTIFAALDLLMASDPPQMALYSEIGRLVGSRPEKGAAVAAAEYLTRTYPDVSGFSPRNLRRMREFYCTYKNTPGVLGSSHVHRLDTEHSHPGNRADTPGVYMGTFGLPASLGSRS